MTNFKYTLTSKSLTSVMASLYKTLVQSQAEIASPEQRKGRERDEFDLHCHVTNDCIGAELHFG